MTLTQANPSPFRTAIITGGNSGLGYACAQALLGDVSGTNPWNVILACRDPARAQAAVERLREVAEASGSGARVEAVRLDLASLASVREFAGEVGHRLEAGELPPLHALICNAGVQSGAKQTFTADGFESTLWCQPSRPLPSGQPPAASVGCACPRGRGFQRYP